MAKKINLSALVAAFQAASTAEKVDEVFAGIAKAPLKQRGKLVKPLTRAFTNMLYANKINPTGLKMIENRIAFFEKLGDEQAALRDYISVTAPSWQECKFQAHIAEHIHKVAGNKLPAAVKAFVSELEKMTPEERDSSLGWLKFTLRLHERIKDIPPPLPAKPKTKALDL